MEIKFISYDGEYPNLCSGQLVLEIDGKIEKFGINYTKFMQLSEEEKEAERNSSHDSFWVSGGCIMSSSDWDMWATEGPWKLTDKDALPEYLRPHAQELIDIFNQNVPWGCCGGCI